MPSRRERARPNRSCCIYLSLIQRRDKYMSPRRSKSPWLSRGDSGRARALRGAVYARARGRFQNRRPAHLKKTDYFFFLLSLALPSRFYKLFMIRKPLEALPDSPVVPARVFIISPAFLSRAPILFVAKQKPPRIFSDEP